MFAQVVRLERLATGFAAAAAAIGLTAFIGWWGGWPSLSSYGSDYIPMAPNTAIAFQLIALALFLTKSSRRYARSLAYVATAMVLLVAGCRCLEFILELDLAVDYWILRTPAQSFGLIPVGEMAFPTCIGFLLSGSATLLLVTGSKRRWMQPSLLAFSTLVHVVGIVFALGYAYGQPLLYGGQTIPMALNTGIAFALLGISLFFSTVARDARARNEADLELRHTRQFLHSVVENIPNMVFAKEAGDLRFILFNRAGEELLGQKREELIGKNDFDLFPREQAEFFVSKDRETLAGGVLVNVPEEPITTRQRGTRYLHTQKIPLPGPDGKPKYLLGISEDVTERKAALAKIEQLNADLSKQAEQLQAANRELEAFAYTVSHDLRAPLRHMAGFGALLKKSLGESCPEAARSHLGTILEASERMGKLIDELLAFSRMGRSPLTTSPVDLNAVVLQARADLNGDSGGREIDWQIHALPHVMGDAALLRQVFANLLSNAIKFTRHRERAEIVVGCRADGANTVVYVRDNGPGFDMQYADKLFGVFQRLHSESEFEGTGIGLATVRRIVSRHGGRTWAESTQGHGATFYLSLPLFRGEIKHEPHPSHTTG